MTAKAAGLKPDLAPKPRDVSPQPGGGGGGPVRLPPRQLDGYVGFANLPNQVYRKSVKRGFEFTLMVVGETGLGKSTLINSMFLTDVYSASYPGPSLRLKKTVQVETSRVLLKEKYPINIKLHCIWFRRVHLLRDCSVAEPGPTFITLTFSALP